MNNSMYECRKRVKLGCWILKIFFRTKATLFWGTAIRYDFSLITIFQYEGSYSNNTGQGRFSCFLPPYPRMNISFQNQLLFMSSTNVHDHIIQIWSTRKKNFVVFYMLWINKTKLKIIWWFSIQKRIVLKNVKNMLVITFWQYIIMSTHNIFLREINCSTNFIITCYFSISIEFPIFYVEQFHFPQFCAQECIFQNVKTQIPHFTEEITQ